MNNLLTKLYGINKVLNASKTLVSVTKKLLMPLPLLLTQVKLNTD